MIPLAARRRSPDVVVQRPLLRLRSTSSKRLARDKPTSYHRVTVMVAVATAANSYHLAVTRGCGLLVMDILIESERASMWLGGVVTIRVRLIQTRSQCPNSPSMMVWRDCFGRPLVTCRCGTCRRLRRLCFARASSNSRVLEDDNQDDRLRLTVAGYMYRGRYAIEWFVFFELPRDQFKIAFVIEMRPSWKGRLLCLKQSL